MTGEFRAPKWGHSRPIRAPCVIVTNTCCFHYGVSGRTERVKGSTIKIHLLFKAGWNFSVNCLYKWILSFWENSLNLLSPAVCRDIGSSLTQHGNHLFFYFNAAAPGEACSPSWDPHQVVSKRLKSVMSCSVPKALRLLPFLQLLSCVSGWITYYQLKIQNFHKT